MSRSLHSILYIEDDPHIRELVRMTLSEQGGFNIQVCGECSEAMNLAEHFKPDLLILDVMLPGENGTESLLNLRALPEMSQVPAIFLTVDADLSLADSNSKDLEPYAIMAKPFQVDQLCGLIHQHWQGFGGS